MPTAMLVSGIAAIALVLLLLVFHQLLRRRYVRLLPGIFRGAMDTVLRNLSSVKSGGLDQVSAISSAFRNLNYDPLQRRWAQCFRDFEEIGGSRAFLDVDEFFRMEPLLEEALERRNANESGKWLFLGGAFASGLVVALGFLLGQGAQFNPYNILGMGFGVFSLAAAFALQYRYEDAGVLESCMEDYIELIARLKECLPPIGRNSLIQTLYLSQTEQAENLRKQTELMQKSLSSFAVDTLAQHLGNTYYTSIEQLLHPPIQKMADVQTSLLNRLERDQQHRLEQLFNLFTKEVGDLLGKQLGGMVDQVNRASGGMKDIVTALHTVAGEVGSTLAQNRETTVRNETLLEALNETHGKLMERFNESTILLDDILTSSKLLAETTSNASVATLELAEQAGKVQKETGERFELLRTTLDERLSASTDAAVAMQARLASHTETVTGQLASHTETVMGQLASHTESLMGQFASHTETVMGRLSSHGEALLLQQVKVQEGLDKQLQSVNAMLTELADKLRETFEEQGRTWNQQRTDDAQALFAHLNGQVAQLHTQTVEVLQKAQAQTTEMLETMQAQTADVLERAHSHATEMLEKSQQMNLETAARFGSEATALFDKYEKQNQAVTQELQAQGRTNANLLSLTNKTLSESSSAQIKAFTEQSDRMAAAFAQQSERLVQAWKQDAEGFYDSLHNEARSLLQVLPTQMREAFDSFTSAMGETMRATLTDSVEIVDKLGERIQQLHSEFELYFSRTEGNTETQISDMRFAMEGAIGKFSELSEASLSQLKDSNQEAMAAFARQTQQLMEAVDEQTRTISLYVKDMGIDMAELNHGLKESVAEFTTHLHSGVTDTFQEFDTGLAEIVRRMTELGVRIEEAVEALPESIGRLTERR